MNRRILVLIAAAMFELGCARPESAPPGDLEVISGREAPLVIELEPRCARAGSAVPVEPPSSSVDLGRAGRVTRQSVRDGIDGWSIEMPYAARDSLSWGFPVGRQIPFAHLELVAALLRTAETAHDPSEFRQRVSEIGGGLEVHVEERWLWLELSFPSLELAAALELLMDWRKGGAVESDSFSYTRRSVGLARLATDSDASLIAERAFARFQSSKAPVSGSADAVEDLTSETFAALFSVALDPEGSVLLHAQSRESVAGAEEVRAAFARFEVPAVASMPAEQPGMTEEGILDRLEHVPGTVYVVDRPGATQVEILVGYPSVGLDHPDAPALAMLASLLGGDVGGRLFRDLRERHGLAYIINASQSPEGRFAVSTRARPERVVRLVKGIEDHLDALVQMPLEPCEIEMIQARMRGEEDLARDDAEWLRARFRKDIAFLESPTDSAGRVAAYAAAGRSGLDDTARRYLDGEPIVILVGDAGRLRHDFEATSPARHVRILESDLSSFR